jgi:Flp pilus assembly protein TadG
MQWRRFLHEQRGQALIITAIALPMVVGFLGMAVDVGHLWQVKRQLQTPAPASDDGDSLASYNIVVARDIVFLADFGNVFNANYSSLPGGSPLSDGSAVLVQ